MSSASSVDLRDAEVEHLHERPPSRSLREEEVRGLEVAMDDPERVRLGDRLAGLEDVVDGVADREVAALLEQRPRGPGPRGTPSRCNGAPSSRSPTSRTRATCSLRKLAAARASRTNRASALALASAPARGNLIATRCPSSSCVAATTTPMPPSPRSALDAVLAGEHHAGGDRRGCDVHRSALKVRCGGVALPTDEGSIQHNGELPGRLV